LCDRNQVDRIVIQAGFFCPGDMELDPGLAFGGLDLGLARVGSDDLLKVFGKRPRRLAVAGRAVPGELTPGAAIGQETEQ